MNEFQSKSKHPVSLDQYPDVMTTQMVCEILRIDRKTVYKLVETGELRGRKAGKGYKIHKKSVLAYLRGES